MLPILTKVSLELGYKHTAACCSLSPCCVTSFIPAIMQAAGQIHPRSQHNYECSCTVGAGFATGDLFAARTVRLWEPVSGETVDSRAVNEPSRSFHNQVESVNWCSHI